MGIGMERGIEEGVITSLGAMVEEMCEEGCERLRCWRYEIIKWPKLSWYTDIKWQSRTEDLQFRCFSSIGCTSTK